MKDKRDKVIEYLKDMGLYRKFESLLMVIVCGIAMIICFILALIFN